MKLSANANSSSFRTPRSPTRSVPISRIYTKGSLRQNSNLIPSSSLLPNMSHVRRAESLIMQSGEKSPVTYNKEFGYSRKDVLIISAGVTAFGYALYYGLQAAGLEPGLAGNWVQLIIFMGICVGWVSTYVYRVATKQMTYVKQLEQYEDAVMRKRLDEMTEEEMAELVREAESEKGQKRVKK
ncbi:hypothetical protein CEUSTIGMA_g8915.t1 [Chlamydomonas eustigma]|uniref:Uncharacterized protein n=1 Tax=Chlamydomonas eustigma TaxID=1157962 RepID=A0A250XEM0_9CHLO|nr:hypothetical protein CEUSTIGMA_g8915.t1 [Chlamydomonas eustigma]|eukprot:GAX81486.1 hypothetical protein CEUSTIGMA_g8915.t1 [Chlamydomonas eustigma]